MTIALAWVSQRADGREHLYIASDSRTRGAYVFDSCPKILPLPRSDCVLCFAGDTANAYPLIIQMANAIAAHEPARKRSMDISRLKEHLLRVCTDLVRSLKDPVVPFSKMDAEFLLAGYSWLKKDFCIWTINYREGEKVFLSREALSFHSRLRKAAFIGDWATRMRSAVARELEKRDRPIHLEPLRILASLLQKAKVTDTIGGAPQVVRVSQHMSTRSFCIKWNGQDTLFGRPLFDYENADYWTLDPFSGKFGKPRKFGHRSQEDEELAGPSIPEE